MVPAEENKQRLVKLLTSLADAQMEQGNYTEAIRYYDRILALGIENPEVYVSMSKAFVELNRLDTKALNIYRKTLQLTPQNKDVCFFLATHYLENNRQDAEALEIYRLAYQNRFPRNNELLPILLQFHLEKNEFGDAIKIAQSGLDNPDIRDNALGYFLQLTIRTQLFDHAIEVLKKNYKRTRHGTFLLALSRLFYEKNATLTQTGEEFNLSEDECDLSVKLLDSKYMLLTLDDVQFFTALAYLTHLSNIKKQSAETRRNEEFDFFFRNLSPTIVLKRGFNNGLNNKVVALNFFKVVWNQINKQLTQQPSKEKQTEAADFDLKRPLIGMALKVVNMNDILQKKGYYEGQKFVHEFLSELYNFLKEKQRFDLRMVQDGLFALAPIRVENIKIIIDMLRHVEQIQQLKDDDDICQISLSLNEIPGDEENELKLFESFNTLLQFNNLFHDEPQNGESQDAKSLEKNRLLLSNELYERFSNTKQFLAKSIGSYQLQHEVVPQDIYEIEWSDPVQQFKTGMLKKLGRFEILKELDNSELYSVYKGRDNLLERAVVIKAIREPYMGRKGPRFPLSVQFMNEARQMGKLSHRNIIMVYDVGQEAEFVYLAREYFDGQNLFTLLRKNRLKDTNYLIRILIQVCSGLKHAHQQGIFHNNLKPTNIIVAENEEVKLTDFGNINHYLKSFPSKASNLETLKFQSPEQIEGKPLDARTDIYSLGIIIFEALAGKAPFSGRTIDELKNNMLTKPLPHPSNLNPGISLEFEKIIKKALARNPEERYSNVTQLMQALFGATHGNLFKTVVK